ncbi:MAG TPA: TIGR03619 family F420-dependent LLM class oxidoreductase [Acidimicrobiales bacterium]|nr:TIGR03619 family F420-dependent LLM class oxidoreductase [Acidimicrobiales bacterium]
MTPPAGRRPRLLLILSENWTLVDPRDPMALVRMAVEAEAAGFDAVMLSEHLALGPTADALGRPENPRAYAAPGNQDPATPWPSSTVLLSAIAAATTRVRLVAGAIIAPLRHPVLLAKDLATLDLLSQGRLVVQPTVSWHRDEYDALGVAFEHRGRILDEQLEAMARLWGPSPASFHGELFSFDDVWSEPTPFRPEGPRMWFGGQTAHPALLRRLARFGHGFHPFGTPTADDLAQVRAALVDAGRDPDALELVGGSRARFAGADDVADLDDALADIGAQWAAGYTTFCLKPSQHTDDPAEVPALCRRAVARVAELTGTGP